MALNKSRSLRPCVARLLADIAYVIAYVIYRFILLDCTTLIQLTSSQAILGGSHILRDCFQSSLNNIHNLHNTVNVISKIIILCNVISPRFCCVDVLTALWILSLQFVGQAVALHMGIFTPFSVNLNLINLNLYNINFFTSI